MPAGVDGAALIRFLLDANRRGYSAGAAVTKTAERDRSTTIVFETGDWRFHDNYFGGEPYGGRAVAFLRETPVWMAVYYGSVDGSDGQVQPVFSFLQRALREAPERLPFRGPDDFSDGAFTYRTTRRGTVERFWGEETIHRGAELVYRARYGGGLVDQRAGD